MIRIVGGGGVGGVGDLNVVKKVREGISGGPNQRGAGCDGGIGSKWGRGRRRWWVALTMEIGSCHWGGTWSARKRVRKNKKRILGHHWWVALTMDIGSSHWGGTWSVRKRVRKNKKRIRTPPTNALELLGLVLYHHSSITQYTLRGHGIMLLPPPLKPKKKKKKNQVIT